MRGKSKAPLMSKRFPPSWTLLLSEWNTEKLSLFEAKGRKSDWTSAEQLQYSRRHTAMKLLRNVAESSRTSLGVTAQSLDGMRTAPGHEISMRQHMNEMNRRTNDYRTRSRN